MERLTTLISVVDKPSMEGVKQLGLRKRCSMTLNDILATSRIKAAFEDGLAIFRLV
jgi:hypothetical protein